VLLRHERRRLISLSVTDHPTADWIARQLTDAFPWDEAPDYMIRDRDGCYGRAVTKRLALVRLLGALAAAERPIKMFSGLRQARTWLDYQRGKVPAANLPGPQQNTRAVAKFAAHVQAQALQVFRLWRKGSRPADAGAEASDQPCPPAAVCRRSARARSARPSKTGATDTGPGSGGLDRLYHGEVGLTATLRAAKGLAAIVDFLKAGDAQRGIAPAYVAAHPHRAKRLAQRAEGVGLMRPGFGHDRR
jgi:hypothetical protein